MIVQGMLHQTPLRQEHQEYVERVAQAQPLNVGGRPGAAAGRWVAAELQYLPYGIEREGGAVLGCELVGSFGEVELEYAAIRRGAALLDSPHRGTLRVTGAASERRDFLNRMLTQELKDLAPGLARSAFWLNRKGRIEADLLLIELGDRMLIDVDIHQAASAAKSLSEFIVMEDVQIEDASSEFHHIALHGPRTTDILAACGLAQMPFATNAAAFGEIAGVPVTIARRDQTGEPGFELIMPYHNAAMVWNHLLSIQNPQSTIQNLSLRPIGWHAFNIARLEAGTPLFNIDFGTTNLPHETGILRERVSFTKGCYLGQEVVARMENLGKPKHTLISLRMKQDLLPTSGEQVFSMNEDGSMKDEIGVVTSSTLSPMLSAAPIALAMLKTSNAVVGNVVLVNAEGAQTPATVCPLRFWTSPSPPPPPPEVNVKSKST